MNNNAVLKNITDKMYFNFTANEEETASIALDAFKTSFTEINNAFPGLNKLEPMTHTIQIDHVLLREDNPVASPEVELLFRNATHLNEREIEVPKVVG